MKCYVVDAFTDTVFTGNPAAVCLLDQWLPDDLMQNIAGENNLSETAFIVRDLNQISFQTKSGELSQKKRPAV